MNSLLRYRNIEKRIRERQKKLVFLRNMMLRMETSGQPLDNSKKSLSNLLTEIKNLENIIRHYQPLKKV